ARDVRERGCRGAVGQSAPRLSNSPGGGASPEDAPPPTERIKVEEIGLIQVGAGVWGTSWAGKIAAMPGVRLEAVVDIQEEAARSTAAASGLSGDRVFATLGEALARTD